MYELVYAQYFQRLVSVGLDTHATINVWDWRKGKVIATTRGHSDRVICFFILYENYINKLYFLKTKISILLKNKCAIVKLVKS